MSTHAPSIPGSVVDAIRQAIEQKIPEAKADVQGGGGHFTIEVVSTIFEGKGMLESQRLVYGAIAHLMEGSAPPVHAIDRLRTRAPVA